MRLVQRVRLRRVAQALRQRHVRPVQQDGVQAQRQPRLGPLVRVVVHLGQLVHVPGSVNFTLNPYADRIHIVRLNTYF